MIRGNFWWTVQWWDSCLVKLLYFFNLVRWNPRRLRLVVEWLRSLCLQHCKTCFEPFPNTLPFETIRFQSSNVSPEIFSIPNAFKKILLDRIERNHAPILVRTDRRLNLKSSRGSKNKNIRIYDNHNDGFHKRAKGNHHTRRFYGRMPSPSGQIIMTFIMIS